MPDKHVLLVDDERDILEALEFALRAEGYSVDVAATASEARTHLDSTQYALVIVDWRLPDGDGIAIAEMAADLRARTIIMSGHLLGLPSRLANRHEVLRKPMNPREVVAAVIRAIGRADVRQA
jgi:two-component system OmpR family response regulator